ncbi:unnamed protein product [Sphagnum balticum]
MTAEVLSTVAVVKCSAFHCSIAGSELKAAVDMMHRKFEHPGHGCLDFLPRKRCKRHRGKVKSFPADDPKKQCSLTAFLGYKAGMTHIGREVEKPSNSLNTIWAQHLSDELKRCFYKNWYNIKKAFSKYTKKYETDEGKKDLESDPERMKKYATVVRVLAHTQFDVSCLKMASLQFKIEKGIASVSGAEAKGNQTEKGTPYGDSINGCTISEKVDYGYNFFEKAIPVDAVFQKDEMIDIIGVTRGHGYEGFVTRWGLTCLPCETHRGLRKVACIGAWHPARVSYTVARAGQNGYHHRMEMNTKVYKIGKVGKESFKAMTEFDRTEKDITTMGAFAHYGIIKDNYIMLKGCVTVPKKQVITLRQFLYKQTSRSAMEEIKLFV